MSAPPFVLVYTDEALRVLDDLAKPAYAAKLKKARKTLQLLHGVGPSHPGLNSHKYQSLTGPSGEDVWESYIENRTPGAWRIWWLYGPTQDTLTILTLGPPRREVTMSNQRRVPLAVPGVSILGDDDPLVAFNAACCDPFVPETTGGFEVRQICWATVDPVDNIVRFGPGGRPQPGYAHPWSRAINARRCGGETRRWLRPRFRGTPSPSMTMAVSSQSPWMRLALRAGIGPIQGIHPGAIGSALNMVW